MARKRRRRKNRGEKEFRGNAASSVSESGSESNVVRSDSDVEIGGSCKAAPKKAVAGKAAKLKAKQKPRERSAAKAGARAGSSRKRSSAVGKKKDEGKYSPSWKHKYKRKKTGWDIRGTTEEFLHTVKTLGHHAR